MSFSFDTSSSDPHQGFDGYHETPGTLPTGTNLMGAFATQHGGDDDDNQEDSSPSATDLKPPPRLDENGNDDDEKQNVDEEDDVEEQDNDEQVDATMQEPRQDAPWSTDWTSLAATRFQQALEAYKGHAKALFEAISTFVAESNEIHAEWSVLQQAEIAESQRLDNVERNVKKAIGGGAGDLFGTEKEESFADEHHGPNMQS